MKKIFLGLFLLATTAISSQQLSGKLKNFTDSSFLVSYSSDGITTSKKIVSLNREGEFSVQLPMQNPAILRLNLSENTLQELFLAPGLSLTIKADIATESIYASTHHFSGSAAKYNQYFSRLRSNAYLQTLDHNKFFNEFKDLPADKKIVVLSKYKYTKDSIRQLFFREFEKDRLANAFTKADSMETQYYLLYSLLNNTNNISKQERKIFIEDYISPYMTETDDPVVLSGSWYKLMWSAYSHRLYFLGKESGDTAWYTSTNEHERYWSNIDRIVRSKKLIEAIYATWAIPTIKDRYKEKEEKDFPELDSVFERMLTRIHSKKIVEEFRIQNKQAREMARMNRNGKPAFAFLLIDSTGRHYKLADFKNKILILDIWASWCGPCIEAFPHMRRVQQKFEGREDIQFVTVSVDKFRNDWLERGVRRFSPPGFPLWVGESGMVI